MNLHQKIASDYMDAMRNKDSIKKNLLSTIKGELETKAKNNKVEFLNDDDVLSVIQKTNKSLIQTKELMESRKDNNSESVMLDTNQINTEISILSKYLPILMSEVEIRNIITEMKENTPNLNIGAIMQRFNKETVDKKMVSIIAKELI